MRAVGELFDQPRVGDERAAVEHSPLEQPLSPVLAVIVGDAGSDLRQFPSQAEKIGLVPHVVIQAGNADAETVGDALHGHVVQPDLVGCFDDHLLREARGATDPCSAGTGRGHVCSRGS